MAPLNLSKLLFFCLSLLTALVVVAQPEDPCRSETGLTCPSCLNLEGQDCSWSVGACSQNCVADAACYSHENFPNSTTMDICQRAVDANVDFALCNNATTCQQCTTTTTSSGQVCAWVEDAGYCKTPGCDQNGVCGVDQCTTQDTTTNSTATSPPTATQSTSGATSNGIAFSWVALTTWISASIIVLW
ncbi:expressed unknown protein [Seminavis robusta]|uniref:Uncharacterized protein n=1 Tax=Seminavis robusta TaxID=568900 RepID=A0A9N8DW56_9STRA|nr:expressed unknown protein [Seminavis robusta]|eukprot:Sro403_g135660.1 n/a (188) ;mRNA; r:30643-31206